MIYGVKPCECKAAMRPKWSRTQPKVFVCTKCDKPVPGYESMWAFRQRAMESSQVDKT